MSLILLASYNIILTSLWFHTSSHLNTSHSDDSLTYLSCDFSDTHLPQGCVLGLIGTDLPSRTDEASWMNVRDLQLYSYTPADNFISSWHSSLSWYQRKNKAPEDFPSLFPVQLNSAGYLTTLIYIFSLATWRILWYNHITIYGLFYFIPCFSNTAAGSLYQNLFYSVGVFLLLTFSRTTLAMLIWPIAVVCFRTGIQFLSMYWQHMW